MLFFKRKRKKIGLALGGGAARGIAHVGVLKAFQKHHIPIHYIAGTSSGSIVGGLFSAGMDVDRMVNELPKLRWRDFAGVHLSRKGMVSSKPLESVIQRYVGQKKMRDLVIPFSPLATNVVTGDGEALNDPDLDLHRAIRASASFPGVYAPCEINGQYYFDGGASANIPSQIVRDMGADIVISVDVIPHMVLNHMPRHLAILADRGLDLILHGVSEKMCEESDFVLKPITEYIHSFQVKKGPQLVEMGMACVENNLETIKRIVS